MLDAVGAVSDAIPNSYDNINNATTLNTSIQHVRRRLKTRIQVNNILDKISIDPEIIQKNIRQLYQQRAIYKKKMEQRSLFMTKIKKLQKRLFKTKKRDKDRPTLKIAMNRTDWMKFKDVIEKELQQLIDDGVNTIADTVPDGITPLGTMPDIRIKRFTDGSIDKYKARNRNTYQLTDNEAKIVASYLVALRNHQPKSFYDDVKSPTARSATRQNKLFMSIQAKLGAFSQIVDIKGAYLKSEVKEHKNEVRTSRRNSW
jgi:hypothetical protein